MGAQALLFSYQAKVVRDLLDPHLTSDYRGRVRYVGEASDGQIAEAASNLLGVPIAKAQVAHVRKDMKAAVLARGTASL